MTHGANTLGSGDDVRYMFAKYSLRGSNMNKEAKSPNSVLLIAASLIAAVRLNREEIKSSPAAYAKIADSIRLAEMIQARLRG